VSWNRGLRMLFWPAMAVAAAIPLCGQNSISINCPPQAAAGSSASCSVVLFLGVATTVNNLTFGVTVSPTGGAPALTSGTLRFADSIGGGFAAPAGTDGIAVVWQGISPALSNTRTLGSVSFTMPAAATTGQTYSASFTGVSASMGNTSVNVSTGAASSVSVPAPDPLSITDPSSLPNGIVGSAYPATWFSASGGAGGYTWTASGLPNGLSISSDGQLSGTPTQAASYNPQFTVTDSNTNTASVSLPLLIGASSSSCTYTLTPGSGGFARTGGNASINVAVASGCLWTAAVSSGAAGWLSITGNASGIGEGTVGIQVSSNGGSARTGALTIGGATYTVYQTGAGLVPAGAVPQIAIGGTWQTTLTIANLWPVAEQIRLNFFNDNGEPLTLPVVFPQTSSTAQSVSTIDRTLGPGAELIIQTTDSSPSITAGWVQLLSNGKADGSAIFGWATSGSEQEAVALNETRNPSAFLLSFDNTGGLATGIAVANISTQNVVIPVIFRDSAGTQLGTASIGLLPHGHTQFMLGDVYPVTRGQVGTAELDVPSGGQIGALGIRAALSGAITSVPVLAR
jgi:hypothetical protein